MSEDWNGNPDPNDDPANDADDAEQEGDEDDVEEPVVNEPLPIEQPRAVAAAPAKPDGRRRKRAPRGEGTGRPSGRIGEVPQHAKRPSEADLLWPDVLERLGREHMSAYEVSIRVMRIAGGPGGGPGVPLGSIEGSSVVATSDTSAADMLRNAIIEQFHQTAPGPATYEITFIWKRGNRMFDRGVLRLPAIAEIVAHRHAEARRQGQNPPPSPFGMGMQVPPPPQQQQGFQGFGGVPQYGYPPYGYNPYPQNPYGFQPPQQQPPQPDVRDEVIREMRDEMRRMSQRIETLSQPAPARAANPPQIGFEDIARIREALRPLGIEITASRQGFGAAPPQHVPPPPPVTARRTQSEVEEVEGILSGIERIKGLRDRMDRALGVDEREREREAEREAETQTPSDEEKQGFVLQTLPGKWKDGSSVHVIRDPDTREIDWKLTPLANPYPLETFAGPLVSKIGTLAEKFANGVAGLGAQQGQQQQKREEPQRQMPREPEPEPPPNGSASAPTTDWDFKS